MLLALYSSSSMKCNECSDLNDINRWADTDRIITTEKIDKSCNNEYIILLRFKENYSMSETDPVTMRAVQV